MKKTILAMCALTALASGAASAQTGTSPQSPLATPARTGPTIAPADITNPIPDPVLRPAGTTIRDSATGLPARDLQDNDISNFDPLDNPATPLDESKPLDNSRLNNLDASKTNMNAITDPMAPPVNDMTLPKPGSLQSQPTTGPLP